MAGRKSIRIPDFNKAIQKIVDEYGEDVTESTKKAVVKVAEIAKKEIQEDANVRTGAYRAGWTVKKDASSRLRTEAIVHNRTRYQLAHLLEKGHALRGGGRAEAFPHIKPAEEHAIKNMKEPMKKIAKG